MIYTAVTRAVKTVVLVEDPEAIGDALCMSPKAVNRASGIRLRHLLDEQQLGAESGPDRVCWTRSVAH
jgi:ATP-dependent exoDNAse (exonuclease V) alpha subunit